MGTIEVQRNMLDGTITILRADDNIQVTEELLQVLDPKAGRIVLHLGNVAYELRGYDEKTRLYEGTKVIG